MNIELIVVGKTDMKEVSALVDMYSKRINHYAKFSITYLPDLRNTKNLSEPQQKVAEGEMLLKDVTAGDYVVLLDEAGEEMRSVAFAQWLQKRMNSGVRRLVLMIGGPYGFSEAVCRHAIPRQGAVAASLKPLGVEPSPHRRVAACAGGLLLRAASHV